eukprot:GHUV01011083.1.p2 GENE.GHUV01011083.1~~GHUV01011083.1.p2  ORF type:complete len:112 (+),score=30.66 GHUV01011083.1:632-967(+)
MADLGLLGGHRRRFNASCISAALLILVILAGLYAFLHYAQAHIARNPFVVMLFPPVAAGSLAAIVPLLMFITYQDDFKKLNPWNPLDFYTISKRCYQAMARNNMKVAEKDL